MAHLETNDTEADEQSIFFRNFSQFISTQLPVLIQQNQATQHQLNQILQSRQEENFLGAPRSRTNQEFLMESLSNAITEFSYDVESNCTFENWFNRYRDLFTSDARNLDDAAKIRLLLRKLDTSAHTKYINLILPNAPCQFSFAETVIKLTEIFGRHQSLFNIRYKCLQNSKAESTDIFTYGGNVNKICEEFKLAQLTIEQFKCLIFVMGLKSSSELDIRTKLLSKLDSEHASITLNQLITEFERIRMIKIDSNLIQSKESDFSILVNKVEGNTDPESTDSESSESNDDQSDPSDDSCKRCGGHHSKRNCPAFNETCSFCGIKGHRFQFCFKKKAAHLQNQTK